MVASVVPVIITETKYVENSQTTQSPTVASGDVLEIDKCTVSNNTGGAVSFAANVVPNGGSAGASNLVISRNVAAGKVDKCPELVGRKLAAGSVISTLAGAASSLVIRMEGRLITL